MAVYTMLVDVVKRTSLKVLLSLILDEQAHPVGPAYSIPHIFDELG